MVPVAVYRSLFHFSEFMRLANCVFYQRYNPFNNEVEDFRNTPATTFKGNGLPGIYARVIFELLERNALLQNPMHYIEVGPGDGTYVKRYFDELYRQYQCKQLPFPELNCHFIAPTARLSDSVNARLKGHPARPVLHWYLEDIISCGEEFAHIQPQDTVTVVLNEILDDLGGDCFCGERELLLQPVVPATLWRELLRLFPAAEDRVREGEWLTAELRRNKFLPSGAAALPKTYFIRYLLDEAFQAKCFGELSWLKCLAPANEVEPACRLGDFAVPSTEVETVLSAKIRTWLGKGALGILSMYDYVRTDRVDCRSYPLGKKLTLESYWHPNLGPAGENHYSIGVVTEGVRPAGESAGDFTVSRLGSCNITLDVPLAAYARFQTLCGVHPIVFGPMGIFMQSLLLAFEVQEDDPFKAAYPWLERGFVFSIAVTDPGCRLPLLPPVEKLTAQGAAQLYDYGPDIDPVRVYRHFLDVILVYLAMHLLDTLRRVEGNPVAGLERLVQRLPGRLQPYLGELNPLFEQWVACVVEARRHPMPLSAAGDFLKARYFGAQGEFKKCLAFALQVIERGGPEQAVY